MLCRLSDLDEKPVTLLTSKESVYVYVYSYNVLFVTICY